MTDKPSHKSEPPNMIALFKKVWFHRWLVIGSLCLGIAAAVSYSFVRQPVHEVFTTVLIDGDNKGSIDLSQMFENLNVGTDKEIENEIEILSSYSLIQEALEKVNFKISYFEEAQFKSRECYNSAPFLIEIDPNFWQLTEVKFFVRVIDSLNVEIHGDPKGGILEKISTKQNKDFEFGKENIETIVPIGKWHTTDYGRCKFNLDSRFKKELFDEGKQYSFLIHNSESLLKKFHDALTISPIKKSSVIKIRIKSGVVEKAKYFLNNLVEVYIENTLEDKRKTASRAIQFIDLQMEQLEKALDETQKTLENFQMENNLIDFSIQTQDAFSSLKSLETEKFNLDMQLEYFNFIKKSIKENKESDIVSPSVVGISDRVLESLILDFKKINEEILVLKMSLMPDNPYYKSQQSKLMNIKGLLDTNIDNLIESSEVKIRGVNNELVRMNEELKKLPNSEYQLINHQRHLAVNNQIYDFLLEKRSQAAIAMASTMSDKRVLDKARKGGQLSFSVPIIFVLGLLGGGFISLLIIVLIDLFNDKVVSISQVQLVLPRFPILGYVLQYKKDTNIAIGTGSKPGMTEAFQTIRQNMKYLNSDLGDKVISISSVLAGEGKTYVSINLGLIYALNGKKTILIGSDLRRPRIFEDFGVTSNLGLSELLVNEVELKDAIIDSGYKNLDLLMSGHIPPNPIELLESTSFKELMKELRNRYDHIIIDTAPVGLVADWRIVSQFTDRNLFVIREKFTLKSSLEFLKETELSKNNNSIIYNGKNLKSSGVNYYRYYNSSDTSDKSFLKKLNPLR